MNAPEGVDDATLHAEAAALEGEVLRDDRAGQRSDDPPPAGPSTGDVLTSLLRPTFDIMAPAWRVSDTECALLGHAYGAVLDKYFPNIDWGVELAALLATAAVFGPRMRTPRHHPKPETTDAAAPQAG